MTSERKTSLIKGMTLAISFVIVLFVVFLPIMGNGKNALQFADDLFNKLSKGSSYFIPVISKASEKFMGKEFSVVVTMEKDAEAAVFVLNKNGAKTELSGNKLNITGDLGALIQAILLDADAMFKNDGGKVSAKYGVNEQSVLKTWWNILKRMDDRMKKDGKIEEAELVSKTMKKGVEVAYNFYGIESQKVLDKAGIMTGLLVFYVTYTLWWGFAIYFLFEGIGLSMKKSKVKQEV
ncbi:hypothetical protein [Candidatus Magnetomonas plexicatena]|uniref:hypothetical protein n=1 Tax=Candidatus Magnetomonas plexicatena TaxID=2552947 RepID=UPI001C75157F|nr:hypothetical protein E2O03_011170 [Nitrospirales bacterium LBB_01]